MEKTLRKYRNKLLVSGMAVLAFGAWSALKSAGYLIHVLPEIGRTMEEMGLAEQVRPLMTTLVVSITILLAIDLVMRIFVGRAARAEALEQKSGKAYLVFCVILVAFSVLSLVYDIRNLGQTGDGVIQEAITIAVGITSLYALLELFVSAIKVKRLKKAMASEN